VLWLLRNEPRYSTGSTQEVRGRAHPVRACLGRTGCPCLACRHVRLRPRRPGRDLSPVAPGASLGRQDGALPEERRPQPHGARPLPLTPHCACDPARPRPAADAPPSQPARPRHAATLRPSTRFPKAAFSDGAQCQGLMRDTGGAQVTIGEEGFFGPASPYAGANPGGAGIWSSATGQARALPRRLARAPLWRLMLKSCLKREA